MIKSISRFVTLATVTLFLAACGQSYQTISDMDPPVPNPGGGDRTPDSTPGLPCVKAELSWTAPQTRVDGSAVTTAELGGYKIFMGVEPQIYSETYDLNDGTATRYAIHGLTQNVTYYFAIKAYDVNGNESPYSSEVSWVARKCE